MVEKEPWQKYIKMVLARKSDTSFMSDIAKGISIETERYAIPHIFPIMGDTKAAAVVMRVGAIYARNRRVPISNEPTQTFGKSLRQLAITVDGRWPNERPTTIGHRVLLLPSMNFDRAVDAINGLVNWCEKEGIPINLYQLTKLLLHWGNGLSQNSMAVRNQLVRDFYAGTIEQEHSDAKL